MNTSALLTTGKSEAATCTEQPSPLSNTQICNSETGRPMQVGVTYFGEIPKGTKRPAQDELYSMSQHEYRKLFQSTIPEIEAPFDMRGETDLHTLSQQLEKLGVQSETRLEIILLIAEGGNAPKFRKTADGQFGVAVSFHDASAPASQMGSTASSSPSMHGFGES